jgi:predicted amidohydrolase YtcJ
VTIRFRREGHPRTAYDAAIGALAFLLTACSPIGPSHEADLILVGARVWTGNQDRPWAEAVAIEGDRILAVGRRREVLRFRGRNTPVLELDGRFVAPGFIDNHTHFNQAGALLLGINLLQVADEEGLVAEVRAARDRVPEGTWITGGDWGAYEAWQAGSTGEGSEPSAAVEGEPAGAEPQAAAGAEPQAAAPTAGRAGVPGQAPFRPHRSMIDSITPNTPVFLSKWDGSEFLANSLTLRRSGASCAWSGVECENGVPTGRLRPAAAVLVRAAIPPKSSELRLAESRAALQRLRESGVTSIHDITPPEQLAVFEQLLDSGELTVRVYARPTLDRWRDLSALGIRHGFGNEWLKIGGLKGFVDGIMGNSSARFYEPYLTTGELGDWRPMMSPPGNMQRLLTKADSAGHWPQVHAIGDHAIDTLLTMFERTIEVNGPKERRFRVIHAQVIRGLEVAARMAQLGVIAEVQPYHAIDDMRWMAERIGERSRWAYAFMTMQDAGVLLSFGSDWPGTNASWYPASPILGIYAAVTRQTLRGEPAGGWYPEERLDLETALRAYTVNNAWAAGEEDVKGAIEPGKLADLVVLDRDPFDMEPDDIRHCRIMYTIVGGQVVFSRE